MAYSCNISDQGAMHFLTCTVVQWVDVFTRKAYVEMVEDSLNFCIEKKGLVVYGYVFMTSHIHLLLQARDNNLSDVLRDFKKFTSGCVTRAIAENDKESRRRWIMWLLTSEKAAEEKAASYQFWQPDNHPEICFSLPFMWQKLNYIHDNPVRAGMVEKAEDYLFSSARDYYFGRQMGRVRIAWLDAMVVTI